MAASSLPLFLPVLERLEGGYVNHPKDPGGATNYGITQGTYNLFRAKLKLDPKPVKSITKTEVEAILRVGYWDKVRGDDLPAGLDVAVFDLAVNSGPSRAVKMLQKILGTAQDGIVGPETLRLATALNDGRLIERLCDERLRFLKGLKTWATFGKGWSARVAEVRVFALQRIGAVPIDRPDFTDPPFLPPHDPVAPSPDDPGHHTPVPASQPATGLWALILSIFTAIFKGWK